MFVPSFVTLSKIRWYKLVEKGQILFLTPVSPSVSEKWDKNGTPFRTWDKGLSHVLGFGFSPAGVSNTRKPPPSDGGGFLTGPGSEPEIHDHACQDVQHEDRHETESYGPQGRYGVLHSLSLRMAAWAAAVLSRPSSMIAAAP
jgi:hypothetical protein